MTQPRFTSAKDAKAAGWFSRRHETPDAHRQAQEDYKANRGKEARRQRAQARGQ